MQLEVQTHSKATGWTQRSLPILNIYGKCMDRGWLTCLNWGLTWSSASLVFISLLISCLYCPRTSLTGDFAWPRDILELRLCENYILSCHVAYERNHCEVYNSCSTFPYCFSFTIILTVKEDEDITVDKQWIRFCLSQIRSINFIIIYLFKHI